MRRRVLMLLHKEYPIGEARASREARAAITAGFEVDLIALHRPGEPLLDRVDGVRVLRVPFGHRRTTSALRLVLEYGGFTLCAGLLAGLLAPFRRYAVVQVHNPPDHLVLAAAVPRLLGARLVFDVHDIAEDLLDMRVAGGARRVFGAVVRASERLAFRLADAVVTVHRPYAEELRRRGNRTPTWVVMNATDPDLLPAPRPPVAGQRRIVFHGTLTRWYGVDLLVTAFARIARRRPDVVLEVYGDGDELAALEELARREGVAGRVLFSRRYLPQRDVLAAINGADVGVIPSRPVKHHGLALSAKLLEYVALGIPVACADLPVNRAHFGDDEVRFFEPDSAAALERAIEDLLADPPAAAARSHAAASRAAAYAWPRQGRAYVDCLEQLADGQAVASPGWISPDS